MSAIDDMIPDETEQPSPADVLRARLLTTKQLADIPKPEPLADGLLYLDSLAMIYGPSGVGKSFVAIDLAMHVASSREWWHSCRLTDAAVLYVAAEGASGVRLRTDAWSAHHDTEDSVQWLPLPVNVFDPQWSDALAEVAADIEAKFVIVDTLARSTVGARENDAADMGVVVDHLDRIRLATGACVLNVHHAGKDVTAGARGSTALKAAMDTELEISGSVERMRLKVTKQKNAAEAEAFDLKLLLVDGTDSGVVVHAGATSDADELPAAVFETLDTLREIEVDGGVSATAWRVAVAASERTFYRHRAGLLRHGFVENVGTEKTPRYQVVCTDD